MSPYYEDESVTLWHGDSLAVLRELPDASVNCCVTSPPYFGLRAYSDDEREIGREQTPTEFVDHLAEIFTEVWRVLADDGVLWLNIGDTWYSGRGNPGPSGFDKKNRNRRGWQRAVDVPGQPWGRTKSLLGIPWRLAFALMGDGWTLRQEVIWAKRNSTPDPAADRPGRAHEQVFMLTKKPHYWFDAKAIQEGTDAGETGRHPRSVWSASTQPFPGDHPATMPPDIAEKCILSSCKPGGIVLDPFSGSGTTGMVAAQHGRRYVGIDLSAEYLDLSLRTRLAQASLLDGEPA